MTQSQIASQFIDFLNQARTPYQAVSIIAKHLMDMGYHELREQDQWSLQSNSGYFVTRTGTSLIAFRTENDDPGNTGFNLVGAHTDSPTLKIKSQPEKLTQGYLTLGVEPYGGALLSTWFDRDLSLAGRVSYEEDSGRIQSTLLDFERPIGIIPNLAIHLRPKTNGTEPLNKQTELPVLVMQDLQAKQSNFRNLLQQELERKLPKPHIKTVLDFDLQFYDSQPAQLLGFNREFITGQRIDSLLSCFVGFKAFSACKQAYPSLLVLNDHEEVGSGSGSGAAGNFLKVVLERICRTTETLQRAMAKSFLVSVDNAHGVHPNYADKHDENHKPLLNRGPVIKINVNQRYATSSDTSSLFRLVCSRADVPVQSFMTRSDLACGTTIGPITATQLGVPTLDLGAATFAMHSIRETCGTEDVQLLYLSLKSLLETKRD